MTERIPFSDYRDDELVRVESHWLRVLPRTVPGIGRDHGIAMLAAVRAEMERRAWIAHEAETEDRQRRHDRWADETYG